MLSAELLHLPVLSVILVSWIGWGDALARLLRLRARWPEKAVLGVSALILAGGALNAARLISPSVIQGLTAAGCAALALSGVGTGRPVWRDPLSLHPPEDRSGRLGWTILWVVAALFAAGMTGLTGYFNVHDDYTAYAAFTEKMLQTGHLGPEPFSERRIVSSLGGKNWLDCYSVVLLGHGRTRALDAGLGWACFTGLLALWGARRGLTRAATAAVVAIAWTLAIVCSNTTAWMLPAAMMLFILTRTDAAGDDRAGGYAALACVAAAACALKSNLIPPIAIYLCGSAVVAALGGRRGHLIGLCASISAAVLLAAPWALAHLGDCGTLLFPMLGRGYHVTAYTDGSAARWSLNGAYVTVILKDLVANKLLLLALLGCLLSALCRIRLSGTTLRMAAAAGISALLLGSATAGWDNLHYTYSALSVVIAAIVMDGAVFLCGLRSREARGASVRPAHLAATVYILCLTVTLAWLSPERGWLATAYLLGRSTGLVGPALPQMPMNMPMRGLYRHAQNKTVSGETVIVSAPAAALLDFRRNRVYLADFPGSAGPPPGMPLEEGVEAWVEYLRSQGVRYVLMDRKGVYARPSLTFMLRWRAYEGRKWIERQMSDALKYEALFTSACEVLPCDKADRLWVLDLSGVIAAQGDDHRDDRQTHGQRDEKDQSSGIRG